MACGLLFRATHAGRAKATLLAAALSVAGLTSSAWAQSASPDKSDKADNAARVDQTVR